jgi:hypothetical protein
MKLEDSRIIARFQCLMTGLMVAKRLGQRRPELTDELYQTWLEVDQRGLKADIARLLNVSAPTISRLAAASPFEQSAAGGLG